MPHDVSLIATIAVSLALAFGFGLLAQRLRLPPLIGYLVAGVAVGPFMPGYVADGSLAAQLAEIGILLMMFGVGQFSAVTGCVRGAVLRFGRDAVRPLDTAP